MNIQDIQEKYELSKEPNVDFWKHKQSGQWILTHDACEKIAYKEGITLINIETLNSEKDFVRFLITMAKGDITITSVGEADDKNCFSSYKGAMAEKRGIDRCILKLIHAYEYGISSEVEADDFKKPESDATPEKKPATKPFVKPTYKQIEYLNQLASDLGIIVKGVTSWSKEKVANKIDELKNEIQTREFEQHEQQQQELTRS